MIKDVNQKLDGSKCFKKWNNNITKRKPKTKIYNLEIVLEFLKGVKQRSKQTNSVYRDSFEVLKTVDISLEKLEKVLEARILHCFFNLRYHLEIVENFSLRKVKKNDKYFHFFVQRCV